MVRVVETHDELENGRFATARSTHDSRVLAVYGQVQIVKNQSFFALGIGEGNIDKLDHAFEVSRSNSIWFGLNQGDSVNDGEYSCGSCFSLRYFLEGGGELVETEGW